MKLLHLSDLHIGKRFDTFSLLADQAHILEQVLAAVEQERPDAVLIAGDIYDKSVPSGEAVTLFDEFLFRLSRKKVPVLIISGNHDSPERLAFGGRLLESSGIHLSPVYDGQVRPITLEDAHGPVHFWLLPFLKPAHVRRYFPEETIESYTDACRVAVRHMALNTEARNVLLTHQFVTGAATCESEELSVGGSDNVDGAVFDSFDYVALGHIHGPQNIDSPRLRYCGTPLKYSFSEADQEKSLTLVELGPKGQLHLSALPLSPLHDMRQLRGPFAQLLEEAGRSAHPDDYLHIILTDEEDVPEAMSRLRQLYPHILKLTYDNTRTRADRIIGDAEDVQRKTPLELFEELYEAQNNQPMSDVQRTFALELIEEIWEDRS